MKTLILMVALSSTTPKPPAKQQDGFWIKQAAIATLHMVSGFLIYQNEVTTHNWYQYKLRHPNANPQWWWPRLSTNNKYKNGDPAQGPEVLWFNNIPGMDNGQIPPEQDAAKRICGWWYCLVYDTVGETKVAAHRAAADDQLGFVCTGYRDRILVL